MKFLFSCCNSYLFSFWSGKVKLLIIQWPLLALETYFYPCVPGPSVAMIKVVTVVSYSVPRARMGLLCSALLSCELWVSIWICTPSSSQIPLTVNDSIKSLTKYRQAPLHHSLLGWNVICLFKAKEPRGQWWDTTASLSSEINYSKNTSSSWLFSFIEISYADSSHQSLSAEDIFFWPVTALKIDPKNYIYSVQINNSKDSKVFWQLYPREKHCVWHWR